VPPCCSVFIATSLDGYIARPDGSIDWLSIVERSGEDYGYAAFFQTIDALVIGRKTYETVLAFEAWPYAGKRVVVLTHARPRGLHGEEFFDGLPGDLLERLSRDGVGRIYVDGGSVIRQFLAAGLVDDVTLSVVPMLLGDGIRLFGTTGKDVPLDLVRCRSFASGLVQSEYRVAGRDRAGGNDAPK
jgi:dihydrofolate reductase